MPLAPSAKPIALALGLSRLNQPLPLPGAAASARTGLPVPRFQVCVLALPSANPALGNELALRDQPCSVAALEMTEPTFSHWLANSSRLMTPALLPADKVNSGASACGQTCTCNARSVVARLPLEASIAVAWASRSMVPLKFAGGVRRRASRRQPVMSATWLDAVTVNRWSALLGPSLSTLPTGRPDRVRIRRSEPSLSLRFATRDCSAMAVSSRPWFRPTLPGSPLLLPTSASIGASAAALTSTVKVAGSLPSSPSQALKPI